MRTSGTSPRASSLLACPRCNSELDLGPRRAVCRACGFERPQDDPRLVDLRPAPSAGAEDWERRQELMEDWYRELGSDRAGALGCFDWDYSDLTTLLARVGGAVVDIGGGLGLARDYIQLFDEYVIVEPSTTWLDERWDVLGDRFPCLRQEVDFVRGVGERLPLRSSSFDAALALWSLNHATDAGRVIQEAHRVLLPGGYLVVVLEDVSPTDADVEREPRLAELRGTALQSDHVNVSEDELAAYARGGFEPVERRWVHHYLALGLVRRNDRGFADPSFALTD